MFTARSAGLLVAGAMLSHAAAASASTFVPIPIGGLSATTAPASAMLSGAIAGELLGEGGVTSDGVPPAAGDGTDVYDRPGSPFAAGANPPSGTYADTALVTPRLSGKLTLASPAAAVTEPETWAMLIGGFGLVGLGMRRTMVSGRFIQAV